MCVSRGRKCVRENSFSKLRWENILIFAHQAALEGRKIKPSASVLGQVGNEAESVGTAYVLTHRLQSFR